MKTVKDLREIIKGCPGDMPVLINDRDDWDFEFDDTAMIVSNEERTPTVALCIHTEED